MGESEILHQIVFWELSIPAWQMAIYIIVITFCMLFERHKLALLTTYIFTLYWVYFLYWGDAIALFGTSPNAATLFLLFGMLHVTLTMIAFFKET
ncbi:MAG: hypothetical protein ACE5HC_09790 [Candidatus Binatia bacterium]